ncbi:MULTISPECIES: ABC transporter substrate-binding protein [unclassified Ornithinimicrobium]|uniref:ABC transporter substrate-binding protein n=1 Tax=unclassified Ornithinimicrobium TaxID=2615080 RepID=UPI003853F0A4
MTHRPLRPAAAAATLLALTLAGCAADDDGATATTSVDTTTTDDAATSAEALDAFPVTVDTPTGEVTIQERPERIVSLSPSATEILFAIGAGDQVVAVDEFSTYPETAPTTDLSGFDPNVEAVAAYEPDLVVIATDGNDLVASLEALDIPVVLDDAPTDVGSGYDGMAALGLATGHADEAAGAVEGMRAAMDDALAAAPQDEELRVYHELDETFFSASSHSFIGSVYEQMGVVNIADEADTDATGYPQLTEESVVEADPQVIVISDQASYTAEDVAARPGWSQVSAVKNGNIVVVDADVSSRWGPRLPQLVAVLAEALSSAAVPAGR